METVTLAMLAQRIDSEAAAYAYLESLRWKNGPVCPHCGHDRAYFLKPRTGLSSRPTRTGTASQRRVWKCAKCRKQFSVITGTIFHGTKVPLHTWLMVFFEMCTDKNGLAAREVERKYGVAPKTAWFMTHRIREAMSQRAPNALVGTIVADETWIGGDPQRMNRKTRERWEGKGMEPAPVVPGDRPDQHTAKTPVLSLINADTREARSRVVADVKASSLRKAMQAHIDFGQAILHTDEGRQYDSIGAEFQAHHTVNHAARVYVDPTTRASTNLAENYFSQLKRSITGTHHHVSRTHLQRYLWEFDYRYSTCKSTDTERFARLAGQVGDRRITYKRVKGI